LWQEEKFIFRLQPDESHYLVWLALGLLTHSLLIQMRTLHFEDQSSLKVLAPALLFAFLCSLQWHFSGFVLAAALFTSLISAWRSPVNALCVTIIFYVCRPWEVIPANEWWLQLPRWCITLWLLSWLRNPWGDRSEVSQLFLNAKGYLLLFAMAFWALVTVAFSRDPAASFQYYADTLFRAIFLVFIIVLTVRSAKDVRKLSIAFATGVATLAFFSLWRFQGLDQPHQLPFIDLGSRSEGRRLEAVGSLGNSNDIAAVVLIPLGMLWPLILSRRERLGIRVASATVALLLFATIKSSQSRGALIAAVAQCGLYFVARARNPIRFAFLFFATVAIVAPLANKFIGRNADDLDASTESRMNYYVTGLRMALYSPVWGQGFGRYPFEFERYSSATLHEWGLRTAHSSWILVVAETGFAGLFIFTAIHIRMFVTCWQLREEYCGLFLALAGYSITILFLSHSWLMFPWILFALIEAANVTQRQTV
jgi:hypothetical protein